MYQLNASVLDKSFWRVFFLLGPVGCDDAPPSCALSCLFPILAFSLIGFRHHLIFGLRANQEFRRIKRKRLFFIIYIKPVVYVTYAYFR